MGKILVTGGLGFIGSITALSLLEKNYEILILDSLVNSSEDVLDNIKKSWDLKNNDEEKIQFIKGDIGDKELIFDLFNKNNKDKIDAVIHFAGHKSVRESVNDPLTYWENNVSASINLFKGMEYGNCQTLVFSSSAMLYGLTSKLKLKEDDPIKPINPYGSTKATIEKILENIYEGSSKKWRIAILRYFNPVGAHHLGLLGEKPIGIPNNIMPLLLMTASGKRNKFLIFGSDWPTPDGTCIRDYIHVEDLAEGHIASLEKLLAEDKVIMHLNLGTGKATSVLELVNEFQRINDIDIPVAFAPRREGDCPILVADNSKALSQLNWKPLRTIADICKDAFFWNNNKNNFK